MNGKCSFCETPWEEKEAELRAEIGRLNRELHRVEKDMQLKSQTDVTDSRIDRALECAISYGGIDGDHHKAWVIDQMIRWLTGDKYDSIVEDACAGEDGPNTYSWDCGTAP
jgi:hypothetical protein